MKVKSESKFAQSCLTVQDPMDCSLPVPHELTANQKNCHFEVSSSFILCKNDESLLDGIVMYDKKWILYDNQQ